MIAQAPEGYLMAGVHCRLKRDPQKPDLALILSQRPATAAGVYTRNLVYAAPVAWNSSRTPTDRARVVVVNSGNANACTGARGLEDARRMAQLAAAACGAGEHEALVLSTGVIGQYLPMDKIEQGISAAAVKLDNHAAAIESTARAMMTTDTVPKIVGRTLQLAGRETRLLGLAKGAGMISPNMATMLAVLLTDATIDPDTAQQLLAAAVDRSFNCLSIDGHMSTNDTVLLLANGAAGGQMLQGAELEAFRATLEKVCVELARAIANDGEGITHLVTIEVSGCATEADARRIARCVADSLLVKCAVAGADPNWGRIVSAVGYAGVSFDPARISLRLNGHLLYHEGRPADFDAAAVSRSMRENREVLIQLSLSEGDARARFWSTDLTTEYVRLNADYHT